MNLKPELCCRSCPYRSARCWYFMKLDKVAKKLPDYVFILSRSKAIKISCHSPGASFSNYVSITCGAVKHWRIKQLRRVILGFNDEYYYYAHADEEEIEIVDDENERNEDIGEGNHKKFLSREDKLDKIQKILGADRPIKIIFDSQINAYAAGDGQISITSGALDLADSDEQVFMIAHEMSHIESEHIKKKNELRKKVVHEIFNAWSEKGNFFPKMLDTLKLSALGFAAGTALSHSQEIEADVKAQKRLKEIGYGEKGGEKFFNRFDEGISLSHPSSKLRGEIIKKI